MSLTAVLVACGNKSGADKPTQVVAKVNDAELSVHQLNYALQSYQNVPAEQMPKLRKAGLDRLIEQEALVQDAIKKKVDRDPSVQQQLEAARKEILVRNHLQRISGSVATPAVDAVNSFYQEHPELFKERNIFQFSELVLPQVPANWPELEKALLATRTIPDVIEALKQKGFSPPLSQNVVRPAEDLPAEVLKKIVAMKDGEIVIYGRKPAIVIAQINARKAVPLDEVKAKPAIERYLLNKARAETVQSEVKRIREAAKVTYMGEFAEGQKPPAPAQPAPSGAAKDSSKDVIDKGIKGLK